MTGHRIAAVLCVLIAGPACRQERPPVPAAPELDRPGQAIPADLDVALRFDLEKARRVFGPQVTDGLRVDLVDEKTDPGGAALLAGSLDRALVMWLGFRPGASAPLTDNVLVLRGKFHDVDPLTETRSGFGAPADLGGGVLLYERPRAARRSAPVPIYAFRDERLVFVSEAEVDSVERVIEARSPGDPVKPEEAGLASFAARPGPVASLLAPSFPAVAEVVVGAESLHGVVDVDEQGLRGSIEARFRAREAAVKAGDRTALLVAALARSKGILARLAQGARSEVVGPTVVVRIALDGVATQAALQCLRGEVPC